MDRSLQRPASGSDLVVSLIDPALRPPRASFAAEVKAIQYCQLAMAAAEAC
jgi:hypothetical protein